MPSDALTIYQDWLDIVFGAILGGDVEVIATHVSLPYLHRSRDMKLVIETRADMERGFASFARMLRSQGVNQFIGLATSAEHLSDDYIEGFHVVHSLRNAAPVLPAYTDRVVLRRGAAAWKLSEIQHGFSHRHWPVSVIFMYECAATGRAVNDDARRDTTQPLALYQRFLNAFTQANVTGDFDGYCKMVDFPCSYHSHGRDEVAESPDDARPYFDLVWALLRENRIEEFARIADSAEFLGGNTICGYHISRFMRGGTDALAPVKSRMILQRTGTRWRLKSVTNALKDDEFPRNELVVVDDLITDIEIQKRTRT